METLQLNVFIMINSFFKRFPFCTVDSGLLVLRIGVALIFIFSGWFKVTNLEMTVTGFASMGFVSFWAYLVTAVELLGGIAVLLGLCTRVAALLLAIIMVVAISVVYKDIAMVMTPVSVLFSTLALTLSGGGRYSLVKED